MRTQILSPLACMVAASLIAGCDSGTEQVAGSPATSANASASAARSSEAIRFVVEDNNRQQSLQLRKREDGGFDVALAVTGTCSRTATGAAKAVIAEGDGEIEVDPDGEGHLVDAFVFTPEPNCSVEIRLDALEQTYAWLSETDCNTSCPLSSDAMVRK